MSLQLDYYYGKESEQYSFYRIPKLLFTDERFKDVSVEAKVLYGILLDRMALSAKNNWFDGEGRVYIIFTIAEMMEMLGCAEQKANKLLNELDNVKGVGLIEKKRRGLGKPNIIYVKNFLDIEHGPESQIKNCEKHNSEDEESGVHGAKNFENQKYVRDDSVGQGIINRTDLRSGKEGPVYHGGRNCENHNSRDVKTADQEMRKSQTNNTDINKTDLSNTDPFINQDMKMPISMGNVDGSPAAQHGMDRMDAYRETIKENIGYDALLHDNPYCKERLDEFIELMAEVCNSGRKTIRVNREDMDAEIVKSRFLKLNGGHIRYVMDCLDKNTTLVGNIRAYMLSALFNSVTTINQYYSSLVSHDMACGLGCG